MRLTQPPARFRSWRAALALLALAPAGHAAIPAPATAAPGATRLIPNLPDNVARPLRYRPDGPDFVGENGGEFFNRPLYGGNTAFRVDAGDRPEFSLYLPGRGGNLRLGLRTATGAKWLHETARITARYRPGEMRYEIRDPLLGAAGVVRLTGLAPDQTEGLIVRVEAGGLPAGVELVWAFGGVTGRRGQRDGDIGTERVPISEYFQLQPEFCRGNVFTTDGAAFTLRCPVATLHGVGPANGWLAVGDAAQWNSCASLLGSAGRRSATPVIVGAAPLPNGEPVFIGVQRVDHAVSAAADLDTYREVKSGVPDPAVGTAGVPLPPAYAAPEWPRVFAGAEAHFAALRAQIEVATPDPYIDAAVGALNVAADAVWDGPSRSIMHGAIAWRTKLLGWRGPYALDDLGWFDRAHDHFASWAARQNTGPIPTAIPPADADANLARNEAGLHSNGDLSHSHYDMNLVYIDALFRHLRWTGDWALARQMWPVIERHLAWERRLFRREYGPEKRPLYEAYAAIWASDDLAYNGGGTAHASAYNYWHNVMAAQIAQGLGLDPAPYAREAALIARGMRELLWTGDHFGEYKDWLGRQRVHPSAALWTFYHTVDSELPTPAEAWQMAHYVDAEIPHLPVRGPGVPADEPYAVVSTTDWMPYTWSINNVVMAENVHAALGFWQAGRPADAFRLMKSALLASMYMGICPGNVGSMNYLDVYRRESQRDFADGSGVLARAIVEGLFGIRPDALAHRLLVVPGFPAAWEHASLRHPRVSLDFKRDGATDTYRVESRWPEPMALRLICAARGGSATITVNGGPAAAKWLDGPAPQIEVAAPAAARFDVTISWSGPVPVRPSSPPEPRVPSPLEPFDWRTPLPRSALLEPVPLAAAFNDRVADIFRPGKYVSPRSPFVSLALPSQGLGAWAGHVHASAEIDDTGLRAVAARHGGRLILPNGVPFVTPGPGAAANICFTSQWDNYPREAAVPLAGRAKRIFLLMAGSTNAMQSRFDNGEIVVAYADGTRARLALRNPESWWPIEQDYFVDAYQFQIAGPLPPRVDLKTGAVRVLDRATFIGRGRPVPGGAATVLELPLDSSKELRTLTVRALANDVVVGLMAATLARN